jgi:hypothetical protein
MEGLDLEPFTVPLKPLTEEEGVPERLIGLPMEALLDFTILGPHGLTPLLTVIPWERTEETCGEAVRSTDEQQATQFLQDH